MSTTFLLMSLFFFFNDKREVLTGRFTKEVEKYSNQ